MYKFNYKSRQMNNINNFFNQKNNINTRLEIHLQTHTSSYNFLDIHFFLFLKDDIYFFKMTRLYFLLQNLFETTRNNFQRYLYLSLSLFLISCISFVFCISLSKLREHFSFVLVRFKNCFVTLCKRQCAKL